MNNTVLAMIGMPEMILIFSVILILFGAKKLPELARGMGQGVKEFRSATSDIQNELENAVGIQELSAPPATKKRARHQHLAQAK